jgi:hypothetical protein
LEAKIEAKLIKYRRTTIGWWNWRNHEKLLKQMVSGIFQTMIDVMLNSIKDQSKNGIGKKKKCWSRFRKN